MFLWLTQSSTENLTESPLHYWHSTTERVRVYVCMWKGVFSLVPSPVYLHSAPFLLTAKNSTTHAHMHLFTKTSFCSAARRTLTRSRSLVLMGHVKSALYGSRAASTSAWDEMSELVASSRPMNGRSNFDLRRLKCCCWHQKSDSFKNALFSLSGSEFVQFWLYLGYGRLFKSNFLLDPKSRWSSAWETLLHYFLQY